MARLIDADALRKRFDDEVPIRPISQTYNKEDVIRAVLDAPTVGGWVSVKDRLPENGQQVVAISVDGFCEVVNFEKTMGRWWGLEGWYPTDRITHWMSLSLPEPPEEEDG